MRRFSRAGLYVASLCGLVTICYAAVSFGSFSLMDGWSYFPLSSNLDAYKDYYYPVTPLTIWEAQISSHFANPLVALRLILLPLVPIYFYSLFVLTRRITGIYTAATLSAIAALAPGALGLEPLVGWNTQSWIFLGIGVSLYVTGILSTGSRNFRYSLLSGIVFSLAILTKQTSAAPVALILITSLFAGRFISTGKIASRAAATSLASLLFTTVIAVILMAATGMFPAILSHILSFGGKALDPLKTVNDVMVALSQTMLQPAFIVITIWLLIIITLRKSSVLSLSLNSSPIPIITTKFIILFGIILIAFGILNPNLYSNYSSYIVLYALFSMWTIHIFGKLQYSGDRFFEAKLSMFLAVVTPLFLGIALLDSDIPTFFAALTTIDSIFLTLGITIQLFFVVLIILVLAKHPVVRHRLDNWAMTHTPLFWTVAISGLLGLGNSINFLSSGGAALWVWYSIPVIVCVSIVIQFLTTSQCSPMANYFTFSILGLALIHFFFVVATVPYSWWGWSDDSLFESDRRDPKLNYLTGIFLSVPAADFYTRIATSADRAAILSLDPEPSVFTFPNIPATATVIEHQPYAGLNCWVQWYDVCPPSLSLEDLARFKVSPAAVIIWRDLVDNETSIHEDVFRQSFSPLRLWQNHKDQEVASGRWIKVDGISNDDFSNLWSDIGVYYRLPVVQWSKFMKIDWIQTYGSLPKP